MKEKIDGLIRWASGQSAPPAAIEIWPTMNCNLSCRFCRSIPVRPIPDKLSLQDFSRIVSEAKKMGVRKCLITGGGEPMMRKKVTLPLMKRIKSLDMHGFILTNGTLLTTKDVKEIVRMGWDFVMFSLDGPSSSINDSLRGHGVFGRVVNSTRSFQICKKDEQKPAIGINMVLTSVNYKKATQMVELVHQLGCSTLIFQSLMVQAAEMRRLKMNKRQIKDLKSRVVDVENLTKKYGIFSNIADFKETGYIEKADQVYEILLSGGKNSNGLISAPCFEPWCNMLIRPDGKVGPCAGTAENSPIDISSDSLAKIWTGGYFSDIRERILSRDLSDICKKCCTQKIIQSRKIQQVLKNKVGR